MINNFNVKRLNIDRFEMQAKKKEKELKEFLSVEIEKIVKTTSDASIMHL